MRLHELSANPGSRPSSRRLGRGHGSGRGKTAGRGTKGQKSRAGSKLSPGFEGGSLSLIKRLPYKRGVGFFNPNDKRVSPVNLNSLLRFEANTVVTIDALVEATLVPTNVEYVKILATGEMDRPLTIQAHAFSASAKAKIEAAGGQAVVIGTEEVVDESTES